MGTSSNRSQPSCHKHKFRGTTESRRRLLFLHHHEIDNNRASSSSSPRSAPVLGFRLFSHPPVEGKNRGGKTRPDQPRSDIGDMFLNFCIRTTCIINLPPSRPRQQRLWAWQPDVSSALGTQQPGSGVSHNLACPAAHYWTTTRPQCRFLGCAWVVPAVLGLFHQHSILRSLTVSCLRLSGTRGRCRTN